MTAAIHPPASHPSAQARAPSDRSHDGDAPAGQAGRGGFRDLLEGGKGRPAGPVPRSPPGIEPGSNGAASAARFNEFGFFARGDRAISSRSPEPIVTAARPETDALRTRSPMEGGVRAVDAEVPAATPRTTAPPIRAEDARPGGVVPPGGGPASPVGGAAASLPQAPIAAPTCASTDIRATPVTADARRGPLPGRAAPPDGRLPMRMTLWRDQAGAHLVVRVDGLDEEDQRRLLDEAGRLLRELGLGPAALTINGRGHRTGRERGERE